MRKWAPRVLVPLLLVLLVVVLRATVWAPAPVEVRTFEAAAGRVERTIANSKAGTIEARRRAKLSPGTSGIVVGVGVERGQRIQAGHVVLRLDDSTQRAEVQLAECALEVARSRQAAQCITAERARRELERNRELAEQDLVSLDVLDGLESASRLADAQCDVLEAEVQQALAAVARARAELAKTSLVAPFDAIVAEVSVEIGEYATPSAPLISAPDVVDAIDARSLYVSAPMDEVDAAYLEVGLPCRITIDPYPDRSFPGRIARVAPYVLDVEQQNRTLEVEAELEDTDFSTTLLPGTSADVEVILDVREDVLRIPTYALLEGERVLVLEGDTLVERAVETGLRNWDWTEVRGGLRAGERVVTSLDADGVVAGARAIVAGPEAPP